jgi:outer membrane protein OmpA-like peptidoglycan-associated protein
MRFYTIIAALSCAFMLQACTPLKSTLPVEPPKPTHLSKVYAAHPGYLDTPAILDPTRIDLPPMPKGYVLKPLETEQMDLMAQKTECPAPAASLVPAKKFTLAKMTPPAEDSGLVWNTLQNYDAGKPTLPGKRSVQKAAAPKTAATVQYGDSISVFPVDGSEELATEDSSTAPSVSLTAPEKTAPAEDTATQTGNYGTLQKQLFFKHGSAHILPKDKSAIKQIAKKPAKDYTVIGHASARVDNVTDPVRKKMVNFKMAQKRANSVMQELKKAGVKPDVVTAISKGDEEPAADLHGKSQEAADRRVDLYSGRNE